MDIKEIGVTLNEVLHHKQPTERQVKKLIAECIKCTEKNIDNIHEFNNEILGIILEIFTEGAETEADLKIRVAMGKDICFSIYKKALEVRKIEK